MAEPVHECCTCKYTGADMQKKFGLKRCASDQFLHGCNLWAKKEESANESGS